MSSSPALDADRWMDRESPRHRPPTSLLGVAIAAGRVPRKLYRFALTPPGVMTLISAVVVAAILAAGGAMVFSSTKRHNELNTLITQTEPLSNSSQELFNSLSVADSIAATGFLKQGMGEGNSQGEYLAAIQDATNAVLRASHGIDEVDSREMEIALLIQQELPKYITLVAQAQTNDRVRNPVGASYLTEASSLMQGTLLPNAQELYILTSREVSEKQAELTGPLWFPLSGLFAAVIILIIVQFWLAAKTHRRINPGFLVATGLMFSATLWASGSSAMTWAIGTHDVNTTVRPLQNLTQARITSQQARTDEALGLVQRDYGQSRQQSFTERISSIGTILEQVRDQVANPSSVDDAREALRLWDAAHARMLFEMRSGDYSSALATSLGSENDSTTAQPNYATLDSELQSLISQQRQDLREILNDGRSSAIHITNLVLILTLISALCVLFGTRPRLQEYV